MTYANRVATLRKLARAGKTRAEAADELGVSYWVVGNIARRSGITFRHALEEATPKRKTTPIGLLVRAGVADLLTAQERLDVRVLVRKGKYSAVEALQLVGRHDLVCALGDDGGDEHA